MTAVQLVGELSSTDKVPGSYVKVRFGVGALSGADTPKYLLIVGQPSADGTITPDTEVVDIFTESDADTYAGAGSEGARMLYGALAQQGTRIKYACATAAVGAVAAEAIITIDKSGVLQLTGTWRYRIGGVEITGGIAATDGPQQVAEAIAAYINARPKLAVEAAAAAGGVGTEWEVTLTHKTPGARGNDLILWQDDSELPSGFTSVLSGGSAVGNGGIRFASGSGTEDITTLLATLASAEYFMIAAAQKDATNLGRWRTQQDTKAGPLIGLSDHIVYAVNGTYAATSALAQGLNEERAQLLWMQDSETPTEEIAAINAAMRFVAERSNPNSSYDNDVLVGVFGQTHVGTIPARTVLVAALDSGITPITTVNGQALIVRAITTRSLTDSGAADDRTLDVAMARVPDEVRREIVVYWTSDYRVNNKLIRANPRAGEPDVPSGIATPAGWNRALTELMIRLSDENNGQRWITGVRQYPPRSMLHPNVTRIVFEAPCIVLETQHQIEGTVLQVPYSSVQAQLTA